MECKNPALSTSGWWIFISMGIATLITLLIIRKDNDFLSPLKGQQATLGDTIGWGILGFFLVFFGQIIAARLELELWC